MDSSSSSSSSSSGHGSLSMSDLEASLASCATCSLPFPPPTSSCGTGRGFDLDESVELSHFLELCFLCGKSLAGNCDIFMYRGDTPFCSEECRQEQIEMDEASEKRWRLSVKASDSKEERKKGAAGAKAQKIHVTAVAG